MSDTAVAESPKSTKKSPRRRKQTEPRKYLRQFADGDFVVFKVVQGAEDGAPVGSLIPLEPAKHFHATSKAVEWLKSGEAGQGRFAVVKFCKILTLRPRQAVVCDIEEMPRVAPTSPTVDAAGQP